MLSVSGIRGIVGASMTEAVVRSFAAAYGRFLQGADTAAGARAITLCIGRDSRPSSEAFAGVAADALARIGCNVIDLGLVATPTAGLAITHHHAAGGIVVTASHNPAPWNGLKPLNRDGVAPPPEQSARVLDAFHNAQSDGGAAAAEANERGDITPDPDATARHVKRVLKRVDVTRIRRAAFSVVLDSINGAGCAGGRMLLDALGCHITHLNGTPDGDFAHTPEPTAANLTDLAQRTADAGAAIGFAQDPDADRLAIIDEHGRYIGEEYTLVLAAWSLLKRIDDERASCAIAVNLSTSRMIDDLAARFPGCRIVRSAVGEANVVSAMQAEDAVIGGEGNGGVILPAVCWVRDSLSSMALVLDLLAADDADSAPLSALVDSLPRYAIIKTSFDLTRIGGRDALPTMIERVMTANPTARASTVDGLRLDWAEGWVHLRPSNTEPIVRLIAESDTETRAADLIERVATQAGLPMVRDA